MDDFERFLIEESERDPEFKKAYDELELEYAVASQFIKLRTARGLTQHDLAEKLGTGQSAVSRLESGRYNITLKHISEVAAVLGARVEVRIVPHRMKKPKVAVAG